MANTDAYYGLRPVANNYGAPYQGAINPYYVPSTYATALYVGDPVIKTGTSNTAEFQGYKIATLPEVNKATAGDGNAITGVIVGFGANPDALDRTYSPASTEQIVWVVDDPYAKFIVQADSGADPAATDIGANANLIYTHGGSIYTGQSGVELDTSSMTTTNTYQLSILRLLNREDNEIGTNCELVVRINNHTEAVGATGI